MYGDGMSHRMQITLDERHHAALVAESSRTGASMAEIVRQALATRLQLDQAGDRATRFRSALSAAAGTWSDRTEDGVAYQQRLRSTLQNREVVDVGGKRAARRRVG